MARALDLAAQALGWCSPNPGVGAVLVRGDQIVGEGFTQPPGSAHAEVKALQQAGDRARGATLFVTLEPCSHQGRTPPCTDALIAAGIAEVVVAMIDPSPWVDGRGIEILRNAGLRVRVGDQGREASQLNEAYFKWVQTHRPFVTLKYAMTADGKIATRTGASRWVTGTEAREYVALLRSRVDAVLVGIGTVLADDPQLTARLAVTPPERDSPVHQPLRVVLDSEARLAVGAKVVTDASAHTLLCTTDRASGEKLTQLAEAGTETLVLPSKDGRVDIIELIRVLGERNVTSILAEPGGTLAAALLESGVVDKVLVFVAPKIVGGVAAPGPVAGEGASEMSDALELTGVEWTRLGEDMLLTGYLSGTGDGEPVEAASVFRNH